MMSSTTITSNPFVAQQRPSPTLNEMRAQSVRPATTTNVSSSIDWGLPPPLQPSTIAGGGGGDTNPFL